MTSHVVFAQDLCKIPMADSFFGFDTSVSNMNDDEGGGGPSEDEYDALNDETFGQDSEGFDWEVEHELVASQLESRRTQHHADIADDSCQSQQLEASLSQMMLDESEAPQSRTLGSSVWRHDLPFGAPTPVPQMKNLCTVEEIERQLRQKQQQNQQQPPFRGQDFFQPRFPPVILQRPPGLQAPVPLPFAPQQNMSMTQMMGQNSQTNMHGQNVNHMGQNVNQMGQNVNQMGQNVNQMGQNVNQMGQNVNQMGQNANQMGQNFTQFMQNNQNMPFQNNQMTMPVHQMNQMGQNVNNANQMGQNMNQMAQNMNPLQQMTQNMNQMGPNVNQMASMNQNANQMGQMNQNVNQMGQMNQNVNQMGQNVNQMVPNGTQFPPMGPFPHMMGQPRGPMMGPPPGMNAPRPNFSPNMGQFNPNFRGPAIQSKPEQQQQMNQQQQKMLMNQQQQMLPQMNQQQQMLPQINQTSVNNQHNLSQSPQSKQQRNDPKIQKSRVYNNSNISNMNIPNAPINNLNINKNLTSQNMVQIIQNTHPMLQQYNNMNNSFHNANNHPMLNRNNNQMYNNNNQNQFNNQNQNNFNQFFNNQRHNGMFNDNQRHLNGDDSSTNSDGDEYAGLMTQREKQWLINIQMLQLNSGTPYIHDFYYTVFLERQANKEKEGVKEAHKANQQNHPFYSGVNKTESQTHRERHNSNRHNSTSEDTPTPRTYVPAQFENSLGKLQCGSVTAPRKIIDVEMMAGEATSGRVSRAASVASTNNPSEVPRETKRTKQLLLDIEALYLILLRLEELNDPLAISNALILKEREEKQKLLEAQQRELDNEHDEDVNIFLKNIESVQRRKQDSPKSEGVDKRQVVNLAVNQKPMPVKNLLDEDKDDLMNRMYGGLLHGDRLQQMLVVRKGRNLLARFVRRASHAHPAARALWSRVLRALSHAARRDDGGLGQLAAPYALYIQNSSGWSAILESCAILTEALDPARTPYALTTPLTLSCVCGMLEKASTLTTTPDATAGERQWYRFLKTLARALKTTTLTVARPVQPLTERRLMQHVKVLESRSTVEILQRGKPAEFTDLSKSDVSELLLRNLC